MTPVPPATVRATKPTRQSRASTPVYSARPPHTPAIILSFGLRRSCRGAGADGGGGGAQAGGSIGGGGPDDGGAGGGALVMARSLTTADPPDHQGTPPFQAAPDPGDHPCPLAVLGCDHRSVTMSAPGAPAAGVPPVPPRPPLVRPRSNRMLAGVAAGTAAHLRMDPLVVRGVFVVLGALGVGVVLYALLWLTM